MKITFEVKEENFIDLEMYIMAKEYQYKPYYAGCPIEELEIKVGDKSYKYVLEFHFNRWRFCTC